MKTAKANNDQLTGRIEWSRKKDKYVAGFIDGFALATEKVKNIRKKKKSRQNDEK